MEINQIKFPSRDLFIKIFEDKVYLVGGTIRDYLLYGDIGQHRDIDLVVTGHTYEEIEKKLAPFGKTNTVGKSFAVVKFIKSRQTFDISVPRKDSKRDAGSHSHKNFIIDYGPHITLEEDLKRRDFSCNSIALRLIDGLLVDPFDGAGAIREKRISMTGPDNFFDDPLRLLRGARFASVHGFSIDPEIYLNSKDVTLDELSWERICEELIRMLLESQRPSVGLMEFFRLSVLAKLFPELYALSLTIQDALFHPEKDEYGHHTVWIHTLIAVDIARRLARDFKLSDEETLALVLATLLHDIGKAVTTRWEFKRGRMTITSMFHDSKGVVMAEELLSKLKIETRNNYPIKEVVLAMIKYHHRVFDLYRNRDNSGFKAISRLVRDMKGREFLLILLDFSDRRSREPQPLDFPGLDEISNWLLQKKEELKIDNETIQPLIMGRDLLKLGIPAGKGMGEHLSKLYELQLDGAFFTKEDGLAIFQQANPQNTP